MDKKIILVEDELFIRDLYKRMLQKAGYNVVTAIDGEEALQLIRSNTDADLVLLDIMLPKMHGIDVLRTVKLDDTTKHLQIVLLSNLGEESIIKEAVSKGARDFIKKVSITPADLIMCVEGYLKDPEYRCPYSGVV
jgi:CheY-like chemotaxis protein